MNNGYEQYRTTSIQTAPPEQLVVMLYDGGIRFLEQAKLAIHEGKDPVAPINRAQDIIVELMSSLNRSAGQIAENLFMLYEFWVHRLFQAIIKRDVQILDEVIGMMRDLRESWATVAMQKRQADAAALAKPAAVVKPATLSARG